MIHAPLKSLLVLPSGSAERLPAPLCSAFTRTVDVAAIAWQAQLCLLEAMRTIEEPVAVFQTLN
jgi:hypothetical protein